MQGQNTSLTVVITGTPAPTYQWQKNEVIISGATSATLTLANAQLVDAARYAVVVTNSFGTVTSNAAVVTVLTPPAITFPTAPSSQMANAGSSVTFTVAASGPAPFTYQWRKNGVPIAGATGATLTLSNVQMGDAANYDVTVSNVAGTSVSASTALTVPYSRLGNFSVRSIAGAGDQTLIVGFVTSGAGTKQVLLRGIGPALASFGVAGALADPQLKLFDANSTLINQNDDWGGGVTLSAAFASVGAFALSAGSKDAALLVPVANGPYSAQVASPAGTGVALVEAYDTDAGTPTARFVDVSARNQVGTGDNVLILGFVISGNAPKTLLIRAIGPTLASFGVNGTLTDPKLDVFSAATAVQSNDNWNGDPLLVTAFARVGAFQLAGNSKDAVVLVTLQPGAYTAQTSGVGGTTGVALVEIYEMP